MRGLLILHQGKLTGDDLSALHRELVSKGADVSETKALILGAIQSLDIPSLASSAEEQVEFRNMVVELKKGITPATADLFYKKYGRLLF